MHQEVCGDGGNTTIRNQNEADMLSACISGMGVEVAPQGVEDDSHCQGVFRRMDTAGS